MRLAGCHLEPAGHPGRTHRTLRESEVQSPPSAGANVLALPVSLVENADVNGSVEAAVGNVTTGCVAGLPNNSDCNAPTSADGHRPAGACTQPVSATNLGER
jgi:hypothetical protein